MVHSVCIAVEQRCGHPRVERTGEEDMSVRGQRSTSTDRAGGVSRIRSPWRRVVAMATAMGLLAVLHAEPCFRQVGGPRKASRWEVVEERLPAEATAKWGEVVTRWLLEEAYAEVVDGRLIPTERGLDLSHGIQGCRW